MIRLFLAALLPSLLAVIALPALATAGRAEAQERRQPVRAADATVTISGAGFGNPIEITAGQTVGWTNSTDRDHSIVADKGEFKSGPIKRGKTWMHTFEKAGTFRYHCSLHPREKGTVVVKE